MPVLGRTKHHLAFFLVQVFLVGSAVLLEQHAKTRDCWLSRNKPTDFSVIISQLHMPNQTDSWANSWPHNFILKGMCTGYLCSVAWYYCWYG